MFYRTIRITAGTASLYSCNIGPFCTASVFSVDFIAGYSTDVFPLYNNTGCTVICSVQNWLFRFCLGKCCRTELIIHRTYGIGCFPGCFFINLLLEKDIQIICSGGCYPSCRANLPGGIFLGSLRICTCTPVLRNPSYIPLSRLAVCGSRTDDRKIVKFTRRKFQRRVQSLHNTV